MKWDGRENEVGGGMGGGVRWIMECNWRGIGVENAGWLEKSNLVGSGIGIRSGIETQLNWVGIGMELEWPIG